MSHTDTDVSQLKINRGAYAVLQQNLDSIGENELIIATDKGVPVPTADDSGKVISVNSSGEYELTTASGGGMTNPMTTANDIIIGGTSGTPARLAKGSNGQVLSVNSSGNVAWATPSGGMTNPMTTAGDIIYGGTSGTPTRLAKGSAGQVLTMNSGATAPTWATPSGGGGITEISTQYIRITDLASGVYKLSYSGTKYIYYNGSTSTTTHTVTGSSGAVVLTVSRYSTNYWHWWYINGSTSFASLNYGYTSSSSGSTGSKSISSLYTGTPSNYYPTRSYTSGLQISSYSGSSTCQLYVPYATYSQYGVVKPAYSTSGTASLTTSSTSYSNSPTINARTTTAGKYYAVEVDSAGRLFVNVPWEGGGSGGNPVQDLTANTAGTVSSTNWTTLKSNHSYTISSPTMTGLDSTYEFVNIKLSINGATQYVKLGKNTTNKYSGLFYIEESTNLYEIAVYYNGTSIILRCATIY